MELTQDNVRKLAELARLRLTDDEVARYQENLGAILQHIDSLQQYVADKRVSVDRRVVESGDELRPDEPTRPRTAEERVELLAGARAVRDGLVVVPRVFGQSSES